MAAIVTVEQGVALIAPAGAGVAALAETMQELSWEPTVRVAVIALDGDTDTGEPGTPDDLLRLERSILPMVAALTGYVAGVALDVALACDIRVADHEATLQFSSVGGRRMMALLGIERQVALLERRLRCDAATALEAGLVSATAPPGEALNEALAVARTIASRGPIAVRLAKEALWRGRELPLEQALRFETDLTLLLQTTKDRAEGVRAFMEKRPPVFMGE